MSRYQVSLHERIFSITDTEAPIALGSKNPPQRGTVRGISSKSRRRLIRTLSKINRPDQPVFVTLTYKNFTDDFTAWKTHLDNFRRAFSRRFPAVAGVWRLEFQARGAPHYHLLLWLNEIGDVGPLREWMAGHWCRIIGQSSAANLEFGCMVDAVTDFRACAFYISLYQSKDNQDRTDIQTGREWGLWGKSRLGLEPIETFNLDTATFTRFRRVVRKLYESFCRRSGRKPGRYLQGLRTAQPFSSFLPFVQARALVRGITNNFHSENSFRAWSMREGF